MESTHTVKCPACGIEYVKHLGLNGTCKDLLETRMHLEKLELGIQKALDFTSEDEVADILADLLKGK